MDISIATSCAANNTAAHKQSGVVQLKLGDFKKTLQLSELTMSDMEQLAKKLALEPDGTLKLTLKNFLAWPSEARDVLWRLCHAVGSMRSIELKVGKESFSEPLGLMLSLAKSLNKKGLATWIKNIAATIAVCSELDERPARVYEVISHLAALNINTVSHDELVAEVAKHDKAFTAQAAKLPPDRNPTILAEDFLIQFEKKISGAIPTGQNVKPLHFHAGTFYAWDSIWKPLGSKEISPLVTRHLQDHSTVPKIGTTLVNDVVLNLKGLCVVNSGDLPLPFFIDSYGPPSKTRLRNLLVLQNGMLDLDAIVKGAKAKLLKSNPCWFATAILPFEFDHKATCPQFKKFLYQVLERDDENGQALTLGDRRLQVLQEWFGYTLLCDGRFQKFLLMVGEGMNGKGVIQNLWIRMLGGDNVSHVSLDQLNSRFALQSLVGKLANICGDLSEIDNAAEGLLKRLTGQDNIMVDRKFEAPITMSPSVKLIFATNILPRFGDKSMGVWRRLIAMPFRIVISHDKKNENLVEELSAELPGILNWAIRGLRRLLEQGHFTHCNICAQAAQQHKLDCDPVAQFLDENGLYDPTGVARKIDRDSLYQRYREWCDHSGNLPLGKSRFNKQIRSLPGVAQHRETNGKRSYYFNGIGEPVAMPPKHDHEHDAQDDFGPEDQS